MKAHDLEKHMALVASVMRDAAKTGTFDGRATRENQTYLLHRCRRIDDTTGTMLIFSRDTGHHSSGWMKNPDYERCWHLSLSAAPSVLILPHVQRAELNAKTKAAWLRAFFGDDARYTWEESAKSDVGRQHNVVHYRLFCDESWAPLLPRGEVYDSEFIEKGWRSASQVLEEDGREIISTVDPT